MSASGHQTLEAAFFSLPAPAAILDAEFRFIAVSNAFLTKFEYAAQEILGRHAQFLYDPSLLEVELNTQRLINGSSNPKFQLQRTIRTRSGKALDSTVGITGLTGFDPPQYVVLYQNLADAHSKENLLMSRAEMFRLMVEHSPLPISVQDQDWRLILVNQAYCDFTGFEKAELLGQDPAHLLYLPEQITHLPEQRKAILKLNVDEFPQHQVIRELIRRDGSRARYSGLLGYTRGPAGESLWCSTLIDLSALDKLRGQLNEQSELAGQMQFRFDRFSSLSDDGIAIVDRSESRIVHANEALARLLATTATTLAGAPLSLLWEKVHRDDLERVTDALDVGSTTSPIELTVRFHVGTAGERWIRLRSVSGERKQPEYFLLFEDITEAIERQEVREREAAAQIEAIVNEVHHRIKNHLQGVLSLLQQRDDADPKTNAIIGKAATQIVGIAEVHGILMNSTSAASLTNMVVAIAQATTRLWNTSVEINTIEVDSAPLYYVAEKESVPLALIINELIFNAVKHRRDKEPISVKICPGADTVRIQISSTGTLPANFDLNTLPRSSGLGLVRMLSARTSTQLSMFIVEDRVVAELALSAPVIIKDGYGDSVGTAP